MAKDKDRKESKGAKPQQEVREREAPRHSARETPRLKQRFQQNPCSRSVILTSQPNDR